MSDHDCLDCATHVALLALEVERLRVQIAAAKRGLLAAQLTLSRLSRDARVAANTLAGARRSLDNLTETT